MPCQLEPSLDVIFSLKMVLNKILIGDLLHVNLITLIKSRPIQVWEKIELNLITVTVHDPVTQIFMFELFLYLGYSHVH